MRSGRRLRRQTRTVTRRGIGSSLRTQRRLPTRRWSWFKRSSRACGRPTRSVGHRLTDSALHTSPLGWRPELTEAVFPPDYAFAGHKVTSPELDAILNTIDKVGLTDVLVPMVLEDLDALLRRHTKDSAPGISGP